MTERNRWNPIPPALYGMAFGTVAAAWMVWATQGSNDRWQDQAGTMLEIALMTGMACVAVAYIRQFISN